MLVRPTDRCLNAVFFISSVTSVDEYTGTLDRSLTLILSCTGVRESQDTTHFSKYRIVCSCVISFVSRMYHFIRESTVSTDVRGLNVLKSMPRDKKNQVRLKFATSVCRVFLRGKSTIFYDGDVEFYRFPMYN